MVLLLDVELYAGCMAATAVLGGLICLCFKVFPANRRQSLAGPDEMAAFCARCGHTAEWHRHYRGGTDCGSCGKGTCPRYQPPRLNDGFFGGLWAYFSTAATQPYWPAGVRGKLHNFLRGRGWRIT